ncbi:hypothetical protein [Streptomyces sp. NPDC057325]|uniref:hypothetical protein n=1 Tax=unclassified Streptomyces TaxID=2593676 RepID=UPI00363F8EFE
MPHKVVHDFVTGAAAVADVLAAREGSGRHHAEGRNRVVQESTPSQAEGERPGEGRPEETEGRDAEPERTTPSQAEGEREPDDENAQRRDPDAGTAPRGPSY